MLRGGEAREPRFSDVVVSLAGVCKPEVGALALLSVADLAAFGQRGRSERLVTFHFSYAAIRL